MQGIYRRLCIWLLVLLAEAFLPDSNRKLFDDPRLTWNAADMVTRSGGIRR